MSESQEEGRVEIEEPDDEKTILVVDPDDYQKTKKLESIAKARSHVQDVKQKRMDNVDSKYDGFKGDWLDAYHTDLAMSVAQYGTELMPLIEEALEEGILSEDDLTVGSGKGEIDIMSFILTEGHKPKDHEPYHQIESMAVYRGLDRIKRKLGLGLELEEDQGPAQI